MIVIGITGQFASGKTTASNMFKKLGAEVIDVDRVGHDALKVIDKRLSRNRKALAKEVFSDKKKLKMLCGRLHPVMVEHIKYILAGARKAGSRYIYILDAAVLIEMGLLREVDYLVVVKSNRRAQISRAKKKWRLTRSEILSRIRSQMPVKDLVKKADFIIDNSGNLTNTRRQVLEIWRDLTKR